MAMQYNPAPLVRHIERNRTTQKAIGRRAGISQTTMVKLVKPPADYVPKVGTIAVLANVIGVQPIEFWR